MHQESAVPFKNKTLSPSNLVPLLSLSLPSSFSFFLHLSLLSSHPSSLLPSFRLPLSLSLLSFLPLLSLLVFQLPSLSRTQMHTQARACTCTHTCPHRPAPMLTHTLTHTCAHTAISALQLLQPFLSVATYVFSFEIHWLCRHPSCPLAGSGCFVHLCPSPVPCTCLRYPGSSESAPSGHLAACLRDGLLLSRVGSTLFCPCSWHPSLSSLSTCCSWQLNQRPWFLSTLPSQLGTETSMRTSLSEIRRKSPELLTARHGFMRKKRWMATYHQGPCSWGPSQLWGPAARSRSTPRGPSLGLLSPAGSRRFSWPEPHHQTHGAGHSGTPWRGALLPAGYPEAPALGSADGSRATSGPESGWSGSDSW